MVYGLNFNNTKIPASYLRKFRKRIPIKWLPRGAFYRLVGVGDTQFSRDQMLDQAWNGRRLLHVEVRKTAGPTLYGVYAY